MSRAIIRLVSYILLISSDIFRFFFYIFYTFSSLSGTSYWYLLLSEQYSGSFKFCYGGLLSRVTRVRGRAVMRNLCCRLPTSSERRGGFTFIREVIRLPVHRNITFHPRTRSPRPHGSDGRGDPRRLPADRAVLGEIDDGGGLIELAQ